MKKLAIAAVAAAVALVAAAETPKAAPRDATAIGTIVLEENLEDYVKVTTNANGTAEIKAADNSGVANAVTVYSKDQADTLLADKADKATTIAGYGITDATVTNLTGANAGQSTVSIGGTSTTVYTKDQTDTLLADKADKATTIAGYGITDAKIDAGTITLGSNTITPLTADSDLTTAMGASVDTKITTATNAVVDSIAGAFKPKQDAVADPTADGTGIDYIATISQDADGVVTATKSTVRSASTSQTGVVQLSSATTSTDETKAATPKAVKTVKDAVDAKVALANVKVDGTAITSSTVVELGNAYIVATTEGGKKSAVLYAR